MASSNQQRSIKRPLIQQFEQMTIFPEEEAEN